MQSPLAQLEGVEVRFRRTLVLRDIDFELAGGRVVGLTGPNGSGKTTFLRLLATLLRPTSGRGRVLGAVLGGPTVHDVRPRIGLVGHVPAVYPELTLSENLELVAQVSERLPSTVDEALHLVGLDRARHRRADRASLGMLRRVDIARLLITGPRLLLLDEPHAGLDASATLLIESIIERTRAGGGGAVLVAHEIGRFLPIVDRVLQLDDGRLVEAQRVGT